MSNAVFPDLPGLAWSVFKTSSWSTKVQTTTSGREQRAAFFSIPIWTFRLSYEFLRAGAQQELQQLVGFFNARQGSFDTFLFMDKTDYHVSGAEFGVGDGAKTQFQLVRPLGGYVEPVLALQAPPSVFAGGVVQGAGAVADLATGIVTFNNAPAPGSLLTWTGNFYYRCRFLQDELELENFLQALWSAKKVEFKSVKP